MMLPVSLSRSIAADRSLTHPKNADGEDKFNELADVLLPLFAFPFAGSREEEEPELLADDQKYGLYTNQKRVDHQKKQSFFYNRDGFPHFNSIDH